LTAARKEAHYTELAAEARVKGYRTAVVPVQVGSRGVLGKRGLGGFKEIVSTRERKAFLTRLTVITIEESHRIWCVCNKAVDSHLIM
jgi:hypothetical protein